MLNHAKRGLEKTYDLYDLEEEKRAWFLRWEAEIIKIAESVGVANALGVKVEPPKNGYTFKVDLPKRASAEPALNIGTAKPWASPKFAQTTAKFVFTWKPRKPTLSESVDLPSRQSR